MSKQSALSFVTSLSGQASACQDTASFYENQDKNTKFEVEKLNTFREHVSQLKEEVNRLCFMMSEIREVLETSSNTANRFLA